MCLDYVHLEIDEKVFECKFYKEVKRFDDGYLYSMFSHLLSFNRYNFLTIRFLPGIWYSLEDNALMNNMDDDTIYPKGFHSFYKNGDCKDKVLRGREIWEVEVKDIICTGEQTIYGNYCFEKKKVVVSRCVKFVKCVVRRKQNDKRR